MSLGTLGIHLNQMSNSGEKVAQTIVVTSEDPPVAPKKTPAESNAENDAALRQAKAELKAEVDQLVRRHWEWGGGGKIGTDAGFRVRRTRRLKANWRCSSNDSR